MTRERRAVRRTAMGSRPPRLGTDYDNYDLRVDTALIPDHLYAPMQVKARRFLARHDASDVAPMLGLD